MPDEQTCELEHFEAGAWRRIATIDRRGGTDRAEPTWLEYDIEYATDHCGATGHRAVSVRTPVDFNQHDVPTFPSFAIDLMPQGDARRALAGRLRERGLDVSDWTVLIHGAGNPVGNLRVRRTERGEESDEGVTREQVVARGDGFRDWAEREGIPMTGSTDTGGAAPKLLLTEDAKGRLHADGALPDHRARRHWLVKFPRGRRRADLVVLANEGPYLDVARAMGLACGERATYVDGALFVPRFDREVIAREHTEVRRLGLESIYSALGIVRAGASLAYEDVCACLAASSDEPHADLVELVRRDALAMALGDRDNHGRNTSLLKRIDGTVRLSPLYDFAPMYLDPEGISRQTRWASERAGALDWSDIADGLEEHVPREVLVPALRDFGERLEGVATLMAECGVDREIIDAREAGIANIAKSLRGLRV